MSGYFINPLNNLHPSKAAGEVQEAPPPPSYVYHSLASLQGNLYGPDVSQYNNLDMAVAKAKGAQFAIIRCSIGNEKDTRFEQHYANARAAGLWVGVYHFVKSNVNPIAQGDRIVSALNGKAIDFPIFLDVEKPESFVGGISAQDMTDKVILPLTLDLSITRAPHISYSQACQLWRNEMYARHFAQYVDHANKPYPAIYTNVDSWNSVAPLMRNNVNKWKYLMGWFAHWTTNASAAPAMPSPWTWWLIRQVGQTKDFNGATIDLNVWNPAEPFPAAVEPPNPPPPPPPPPQQFPAFGGAFDVDENADGSITFEMGGKTYRATWHLEEVTE